MRIVLGVAVLTLLSGAQTALAHSTTVPLLDLHGHPTAAVGHGFPILTIPFLLVLALVVGVALTWTVVRRLHGQVLALALTLTLAVLMLESAVHSVHHLDDSTAAAACAVLGGSHHLSWAAGDSPPAATSTACVSALPQSWTEDIRPAPHQRRQWGRAPPA